MAHKNALQTSVFAALLLACATTVAGAQQVTGTPGSPTATTTIPATSFRRRMRNSAA
jgi:hypothetical protein